MKALCEPAVVERIHDALRRLGLSANYQGYGQMLCALELAWEEPERLLLVTKEIYPDVAKRCRATWGAVERNLRTAVKVIWRADTPLLWEVMGKEGPERPCNARFLALLTAWLEEDEGEGHGARSSGETEISSRGTLAQSKSRARAAAETGEEVSRSPAIRARSPSSSSGR